MKKQALPVFCLISFDRTPSIAEMTLFLPNGTSELVFHLFSNLNFGDIWFSC